ncbi:MAG: alpha-amylase family glycosyl hydrolase [Bacteroidota bacterium]
MTNYFIILLLLFSVLACTSPEIESVSSDENSRTVFDQSPTWAHEVVWYEIGVERFRNGDPSNDPTTEDIVGAYPGVIPDGWSITPWTQDWYKPDPYFANYDKLKDVRGNAITKFVDKVQIRRYGGDLQGVLDKVDYLDSLGITAVYFRPLNDGPSLHKYDARNWRHIDVNFGPNPAKDKAIMASEIPDDPSTWKMTEADQLFIKVIDGFHQKGIKVILDYSWNHTGSTFWAWNDLVKNQAESKFKDWYWVEQFDDPNTPENEFKYHGWVGVPTLPEIKETQKQDLSKSLQSFEGNIFDQTAKQHIFNVAQRWLDPNGDGDPSDGVDGYRLDVAAETPLGFWRDFRTHVRSINPDAYLMGEIWWEAFPDRLLDPAPFLNGDVFDAVMNYRWYRAIRHFFNESPNPIAVEELVDSLNRFRSNIRPGNNFAMMNYTGGFDTPRILTSLFNKNLYKYQCKVHENPAYKIHKPDVSTYQTLKLLLTQQYTYIGAPHIYNGDEMGMWGADDPSCRKPLIWPDYTFENEKAHPLGQERPEDRVVFDQEVFQYHQKMIKIRKENPVLIHGDIEFFTIGNLLAYRRFDETQEMIMVFNHELSPKEVQIQVQTGKTYKEILQSAVIETNGDQINLTIGPRSAYILERME